MKQTTFRLWLVLSLLILSGCTSAPAVQDTATPVSPATATISVATATVVPTAAAVATATDVPTAAVTVAPTVASEPTDTPAMPANTPERSEEQVDVVEKAGDADSQESEREDAGDAVEITLGENITVAGPGVTVDGVTVDGVTVDGATIDGSVVTITAAGAYRLRGALDDGQIIVDTQDEEDVELILDGVDITCSTSAPIYVANAKDTVIILADGSENYVTDGESYVFEDAESDEPNAAIFSHDDLVIRGNGALIVQANYNNGIQSKDDLRIKGGNLTVHATNDGIKGKDTLTIREANVIVEAGGDGMQSNEDADPEKGVVSLDNSTVTIIAGEDGIQAETSLSVSGGYVAISSGGGSANSSKGENWGNWGTRNDPNSADTLGSAKGLKAGVDLTVEGATIHIDSSDDAMHSNDTLTILSGSITIASGDDGIHADSSIEIDGGEIVITESYEGIESAVITLNDGNIHLTASDDGMNIVGGVDGSGAGGRPGFNTFNSSGNNHLDIHGGYYVIDATGDGIDVNGAINMTGGVVIVHGPTGNMNGALDYDRGFTLTGGFLVAAGSVGMAQAPDTSSTQCSVMLNPSSAVPAGAIIRVESEAGEDIVTFAPIKAYQSVVISSPELTMGSTYAVYFGGQSTGDVTDGLYSGGTYSDGSQAATFTISDVLTVLGSAGGMGRGGGRR